MIVNITPKEGFEAQWCCTRYSIEDGIMSFIDEESKCVGLYKINFGDTITFEEE